MAVHSLQHENSTIWFVVDGLGMPWSPGYLDRETAEQVDRDGEEVDWDCDLMVIPDEIDVSEILQDESTN